jgi:hypothetical protein
MSADGTEILWTKAFQINEGPQGAECGKTERTECQRHQEAM